MSYQGKIVFVEFTGTKPGGSNYYNGEYLVIRDTPATLYGVKLAVGYGGHQTQQLPKVGEGKFTVAEAWTDNNAVRQWAADCKEFIRKFRSGETKAQWIDSVYNELENNVRAALRAIGDMPNPGVVSVSVDSPTSMDVNVPAGVKSINLKFA